MADKFLLAFIIVLFSCSLIAFRALSQDTDTLQGEMLFDSTSVEITLGMGGKTGVVLTPDNVPLPFAIITNPAGQVLTVADVNGVFRIPAARRARRLPLVVHHPDFTSRALLLSSPLPDSVIVRLEQPQAIPSGTDNGRGEALIRRVLQNREQQDLNQLPGFTYRSYNKFAVNVDRRPLRRYLPKFVKVRLPFLVPPEGQNYHLYLMETVSQREYRDRVQDRETILATRATGINDPTLLTPVTQLQPLNIFEEYLRIATATFISPLSPQTVPRHTYHLVQAFPYQKDTLYVVRYAPERWRNFDGLKGYLYINSRDYSVQQIIARQSEENALKTEFYQNYSLTESGFYFPDQIRSAVAFRNLSSRRLQFFGTYSSYLDSVQILSPVEARIASFDDVLVKAVPGAGLRPEGYWDQHRKVTLSPMNLYTQHFYDSLELVKDFDRYLRFVNKVMTNTVPFKFLDVKLKYLFRYNNYEGIRPGFGVQTNEQLSSRFNVLGWVGYGFRDADAKYGTVFTYFPDPQKQSSVSLLLQKEAEESATPNFPFDRRQFASELVRTYRIRIMDIVRERRLTVETRQFPHVAYSFYVSDNSMFPAFNYRFQENPRRAFSYFDLGFGLKFAYREKFVMTPDRKVSVGSPYPTAWLHLTQGLRGVMDGEFNYTKIDAKVEQSWRILFKGVTTAQVIGGTVFGSVPYSKLYNGNGSYAFASVVAHNSFETMRYNEFLNSSYLSFFLSHNLGKLIVRKGDFNPDLELLHNMGIGWLRKPENHQNLPFKTMERGYFESGFFVNDIHQFQVSFAKIGIGAGFFYRYGPYSEDKVLQNIYFKFSTRVGL